MHAVLPAVTQARSAAAWLWLLNTAGLTGLNHLKPLLGLLGRLLQGQPHHQCSMTLLHLQPQHKVSAACLPVNSLLLE